MAWILLNINSDDISRQLWFHDLRDGGTCGEGCHEISFRSMALINIPTAGV